MTPILDLYILAKLDRGLETPYDLQREAGLSLGAIVPALRRLSAQKLVTKAESLTSTKRPRHSYTLTKAGEEKAKTGWKEYLQRNFPPADLDALLRLVDVALQYGAKKSRLSDLLRAAAKQKLDLASQIAAGIGGIPGAPLSYRAMRAQVEIERLQAEQQALTAVADTIVRKRVRGRAEKRGFKEIPGQQHFSEVLLEVAQKPR